MQLRKGNKTHFWIDDLLIDILLLETEISRTANGRIIHDINLALSCLKRIAWALYDGNQQEAESENIRWALGFLYRWGIPGIPLEMTNVRDKGAFGTYLRQII